MVISTDILLSTYNGEKYLKDLFHSLERQSFKDFRVLVRDDGSTDSTWKIISDHRKAGRIKIEVIPTRTHIGIVKSFNHLLQSAKADYIMFCDQDDVWTERKIEKTLNILKKAEQLYSKKTPLLIHTDLEVVNESLNHIAPSMWALQKINGQNRTQLNQILIQNCITGCTMLINRALASTAGELPGGILMHDWYFGILAAAFGKIIPIPEPLVKYRQHGSNVVGSKKLHLKKELNNGIRQGRRKLLRSYSQAGVFQSLFKDKLNNTQRSLVHDFVSIPNKTFIDRRWVIIKHGFWKTGFMKNIGLLVLT